MVEDATMVVEDAANVVEVEESTLMEAVEVKLHIKIRNTYA